MSWCFCSEINYSDEAAFLLPYNGTFHTVRARRDQRQVVRPDITVDTRERSRLAAPLPGPCAPHEESQNDSSSRHLIPPTLCVIAGKLPIRSTDTRSLCFPRKIPERPVFASPISPDALCYSGETAHSRHWYRIPVPPMKSPEVARWTSSSSLDILRGASERWLICGAPTASPCRLHLCGSPGSKAVVGF